LPVLVLLRNSELGRKRRRKIAKDFGGNYIRIHPEDENQLEI